MRQPALLLPLLACALLVLYPLALVLATPFAAPAGFAVLASPLFLRALWHTAWIAGCGTLGCLMLGLTLAVGLAFVPFPGAGIVARVIDSVIALPTFLVALAFTFVYGAAGLLNGALLAGSPPGTPPPVDFLYSQWGVILAEITVYTPFVLRPLLAGFARFDRSLIEIAASLGAGPWRILRRVILPEALPALLAGGSLCLLLTVNEFGIVFFIGAKGVITLPLLVYDKAIQEFDYPAACTAAAVNLALSLLLFAAYRAAIRAGAAAEAD